MGRIKQVDTVLKIWVQNRISIIRELVGVEEWDFLPTNFNPGDIATGIISPKKLVQLELWCNETQFLLHEKRKWSVQKVSVEDKKLLVENKVQKGVVFIAAGGIGRIRDVITCEWFRKFLHLRVYCLHTIDNCSLSLMSFATFISSWLEFLSRLTRM